MSKIDYTILEDYSPKRIAEFNKSIEDYLGETTPLNMGVTQEKKLLKEAVAYFYLTLHKLENEVPALDTCRFEYQHIYTHHIEKLKARMLNLADSMTTDERQAKSIKGLIKDFCNMAHYDGRKEFDRWALEAKIISKNDLVPVSNLN